MLFPIRWTLRLLFPAALLLLIAMWYYTSQLNEGAFEVDHSAPDTNVRIVEVTNGRIRIAPLEGKGGSAWDQDGLYGLEWPGGYARIGRIIDRHPDSVLRELTVNGEAPVAGGEARIDTFVYRGDPGSALGIGFEDVTITTPAGEAPAWLIPGSSGTWAVFVHGKGSSREEAFRILPTLRELGLPVLIVTYRNDPEFVFTDVEAGEGSRYSYGETEWEDLAAAMDYAGEQGAERFVLFGNSMGGGIVMALLQRPEYAERIAGVVLDSPVLDLKRTVEFRAGQRKVPSVFTKLALQFATWRDGIDWPAMDYLQSSDSLTAPVLVFHGDDDETVPFSTSDLLKKARPELVTLHRLEGVGHVQGWNRDRELYTLQLQDFLGRILQR